MTTERAAHRAPRGQRRAAVLVGLCLTLGIAALTILAHRAAGPLWRDEVNSVNVAARTPIAAVVDATPYDSFPLAWPLVLHAWIAAGQGDSDQALRRLGATIVLATLAVVWWAGRRLEIGVPLATLLLFGLSPSEIVYGSMVRGYGLGALAIVWCTGATWSYVRAPTRARFLVLVLATVLAVQTYFANAFLVVALALGAAAATLPRRRFTPLGGVIAAYAVGAASVLLNLASFTYALQVAPIEQTAPPLSFQLGVFRQAVAPGAWPLAVAWIVAPLLAIAGAVWTRARPEPARDGDGDLAAFALVTGVAALLTYFVYLSGVAKLPTQLWYYLSLMAVLALTCDAGTTLLARRFRHGELARTIAVALVALAAAAPVAATVPFRMTNLDTVAATIARAGAPSDLAVVFPWYMGITLERYQRGDVPWITLPELSEHDLHLHLEIRDRMRRGATGVAAELARVEQVLRAGGSVWVVGGLVAPPPGDAAPSLPPAPNGPTGWRAGPYLDMWELQLGALLREHAGAVERVALPDLGQVNAWENVPLYRASGWR
jgi:hypothetical protein